MSSAYSMSVDWQEEQANWTNIGRNTMEEFYQEHPKAAEKDGHDLDENGEVKYLYEVLDGFEPMMNYAYPLMCDPTNHTNRIIKVCRTLPLTVMYKEADDTYYLALTGGGMDLSQCVARAYQILEVWIPADMLKEISKQPELALYGKEWRELARGIRQQIKMEIDHLKQSDKEWLASIKEFNAKKAAKKSEVKS